MRLIMTKYSSRYVTSFWLISIIKSVFEFESCTASRRLNLSEFQSETITKSDFWLVDGLAFLVVAVDRDVVVAGSGRVCHEAGSVSGVGPVHVQNSVLFALSQSP